MELHYRLEKSASRSQNFFEARRTHDCFDRGILLDDEGIAEVGLDSSPFCVNPVQAESLPDAGAERVEVKVELAGDDDGVGLASETVDFYGGGGDQRSRPAIQKGDKPSREMASILL